MKKQNAVKTYIADNAAALSYSTESPADAKKAVSDLAFSIVHGYKTNADAKKAVSDYVETACKSRKIDGKQVTAAIPDYSENAKRLSVAFGLGHFAAAHLTAAEFSRLLAQTDKKSNFDRDAYEKQKEAEKEAAKAAKKQKAARVSKTAQLEKQVAQLMEMQKVLLAKLDSLSK